MMENREVQKNTQQDYRKLVNQLGKKEFTLLKMQEYGFWPKDLPTPFERQLSETPEKYSKRQALMEKYQKIIDQIAELYKEKDDINKKLMELKKQYDDTWDYEKIRQDVAQKIMKESIKRRKERKLQRELEKNKRSEAWKEKKSKQIVFIGKGYSGLLNKSVTDEEKLISNDLPIVKTDAELAEFLEIDYKMLRFLAYHRDVLSVDHYYRYTIPKKKGGNRNIAAPKSVLKNVQRKILDRILVKCKYSNNAHGFIIGKSVVTAAIAHILKPEVLINMDIEDFFPTITFKRVLGMFREFGYSGYISSLLAMLCTYCERIPIEVNKKVMYVVTSSRILPQGSPASPMISNIICKNLDKRLNGLANKYGLAYTRYADDMSFSAKTISDGLNYSRFCGLVAKILSDEGFKINKSKTRFLRKNNRQEITGITVNNEYIGIPRKWMKKFRAAIYNANKLKQMGNLPDEVKKEIAGMAAWVNGVNADIYKDIINVANKLLDKND